MSNGLLNQVSAEEIKKRFVWKKGKVIPNPQGGVYDPNVWRWDDNGNVIKYEEYGKRSSQYGWEMDHHPTASVFGGSDDVSNLRPLHCVDNARHGGILGGLINR